MQYSSLLALGMAAATFAAPVAEPENTLMKRDNCVMIGEYEVEVVIGGGGPGQAPVSYDYSYLYITYQGGVQISPSKLGDPITGDHQTFQPSQTRMQDPITWYADFNLGYRSCTVEYQGRTWHGGPATPAKTKRGTTKWQCNVTFGCEGGHPPISK